MFNVKRHFQAGAVAFALVASGCAVNPDTGRVGMDTRVFNRDSITTVGGTIAGAALCNQLFKGHGSKKGWTAACGIGGYFLSRAFLERSSGVLENNQSGQRSTWRDPDGHQVAMTPTRTYYQNDQPCREYETEVMIDGRREIATGRACRRGDGTWKIQS